MKETLKNAGAGIVGLALMVAPPVAGLMLFMGGSRWLLEHGELVSAAVRLALLGVVGALILAAAPALRSFAGSVIIVASFIFGIAVWLMGLAATLTFWGWFAVTIGLLFMGIGVVPMGIAAAFLNGEGAFAGSILINLVLVFVTRFVGAWIAARASAASVLVREG
jgi:hypothetical protein